MALAASCFGGFLLIICMTVVKSQILPLNSSYSSCTMASQCNTTGGFTCDLKRSSPVCKVKYDFNCTSTADCVAGATCMSATSSSKPVCTCTSGVSSLDGTIGLCNPGSGRVGGVCSNGACFGSAVCEDNKCICNATLYTTNYVDYSCTPLAGKAGGPCVTSANCELNAYCSSNACMCNVGYTKDASTLRCYANVKVKVGVACNYTEDCTPNAECHMYTHKCQCHSGYSLETTTATCKVTSDAVTAAHSFLLLLMALMMMSLMQ